MDCKIVFLKPLSGFRTELRSDTLFNVLCWAIRQTHGNDILNQLLRQYAPTHSDPSPKDTKSAAESKEDISKAPFYISSTFPYKEIFYPDVQQKLTSIRVPYFPKPLSSIKPKAQEAERQLDAEKRLKQYRLQKELKKETYVSKYVFEQSLGVSNQANPSGPVYSNTPKVQSSLITHNRISRLTGSTLDLEAGGQLFHSPDHKIKIPPLDKEQKAFKLPDEAQSTARVVSEEGGLFFLVRGNFEILEAPLRLLRHLGVGGDRNIGKGTFDISWEDFQLAEPSQRANAVCNLSLYFPDSAHIDLIQNSSSPAIRYELTHRSGIRGGFMQRYQRKPIVDMIQEGAVLPILPNTDHYGSNVYLGNDHRENHKLWQYGYGFMVNMYVPF